MENKNEHVAVPRVYYECDPSKNAVCNKRSCHIYGGPCKHTTNVAFAKQPVKHVKLVFPVEAESMKDILSEEEK